MRGRRGWISESGCLAFSNKCSWCKMVMGTTRAVENHMEKVSKGEECWRHRGGSTKARAPVEEVVREWKCKICNAVVEGGRRGIIMCCST